MLELNYGAKCGKLFRSVVFFGKKSLTSTSFYRTNYTLPTRKIN